METMCLARALRLRHKVLLRELADAAGLSVQQISRIELERERQTPGEEAALQRAFELVARRRQEGAARLLADVQESRGRLFTTAEEESN